MNKYYIIKINMNNPVTSSRLSGNDVPTLKKTSNHRSKLASIANLKKISHYKGSALCTNATFTDQLLQYYSLCI